jgi:hypothetical protein
MLPVRRYPETHTNSGEARESSDRVPGFVGYSWVAKNPYKNIN